MVNLIFIKKTVVFGLKKNTGFFQPYWVLIHNDRMNDSVHSVRLFKWPNLQNG